MSFPHDTSALVGRVLRGATIGDSRPPDEWHPIVADLLTLETDAAPVVWEVEGDCCSESRFTDLKLDAVLGKRITVAAEVESIVDPALDPATLRKFNSTDCREGRNYDSEDDPTLRNGSEVAPQESEQIYGVKLTAEDGTVGFVIYRNWSNGYYGGMLSERGSAGAP